MPEPSTSSLKVPGLEPVDYVVVKTADGHILIRHPDELEKKTVVQEEQG